MGRALAAPALLRWSGALLSAVLSAAQAPECGRSIGLTPLIDLGADTYQGHAGGLYPGGVNEPPAEYLRLALDRGASVVPRGPSGAPDPERGLIGLVAIGLSNTAHEFGRFERMADADTQRNPRLVLVNAAQAGQSSETMVTSDAPYWESVDERLAAVGVTAEQVQVVWVKQRRAPAFLRSVLARDEARRAAEGGSGAGATKARGARISVLRFPEHAEQLRDELDTIAQVLAERFPNLALCYLSDRTYEEYAGAEPKAYETGFAIKWLVERRIDAAALARESQAGSAGEPALLWGPYLWADGPLTNGRGTRWCRSDYELEKASHPSPSGEQKVADLLAAFLKTDPTARSWYVRGAAAPLLAIDSTADAHVDAAQPDANFGSDPVLLSSWGASAKTTYVRFDLSGLRRPVLHAKLSFRTATELVPLAECDVFTVADDDWDERTLCRATAPAAGRLLGRLPNSSRDGTRSLDVTAEVNGHADGQLTLALILTEAPEKQAAAARLVSREGGAPPRLVVIPAADRR